MKPRTPRAERVSVSVEFLLMGCVTGSWAARIPDVRAQVQLDDARWGVAIVAVTIGSLLSTVVTLAFVARWGSRRLALGGASVLILVAPFLGASKDPLHLVVGLALLGIGTGLLAPSMNAQAVEVERRYQRRIMSSVHACFSLGQLLGGAAGIAAAHYAVTPTHQLTASSAVLAALLAATVRQLPADPVRIPREGPASTMRSRISPQLLLLAVVALLASINEGVAVQWSAQYSAVTLAAGTGIGAATFTTFSIAMATSRLFGDRITYLLGARRFIQVSEAVVAVGLAGGLLIGTPAAAIVAFALVGVGSACIVPTVMTLAGTQPGLTAGQGVGVIALAQWPAFLLGPPMVGLLAGAVGLRWALLLAVAAAALIVFLAQHVASTAPGDAVLATGSGGSASP